MSKKLFVMAVAVVLLGTLAYAELQNVEVGGKIRIRGSWYQEDWDNEYSLKYTGPWGLIKFRIPLVTTHSELESTWIEQRTRLNVKADFTDEVTAFIELDSYDIWGEDFRSRDYVTGVDTRAVSVDDVEVYQAYIEAREMWGTPLRLKVGRQEITLGSGWLVGTNDKRYNFRGLSWDAVRLGYVSDTVTVDAIAAKLVENQGDILEDDLDLYGVYGSYTGLEDIVIDAYWLYLRDDASGVAETIDYYLGLVPYLKPLECDLHTVGLRGAGKVGAFDFEAEVAYQFGNIDADWWRVYPFAGIWGLLFVENDVDINAWGVNLEAGYTFDISWQPRIYAGFAFLEGPDMDDDWKWLGLKLEVDNELAFNRLFSNWEYSDFIDEGSLSNVFIYRLGLNLQPTEAIKLGAEGLYYRADKEIVDKEEIGWELQLTAAYQYSEDLVFRAGYSHFFGGDAAENAMELALPTGVEVANAILHFLYGGVWRIDRKINDIDGDYLFIETEISF